jgi:hypothetical protein
MTTHGAAPTKLQLGEGPNVQRVWDNSHASSLKAWARAYGRLGLPVFPLAAGTNVPAISRERGGHGCLDASADADQIDLFWQWAPGSNVGIATGKVAGISVLDVDTKSNGHETLATLIAEHGPLPEGPIVATPSGGRHFYFRYQPGLKCSAGQIGPGLDVRNDGGYVAAPPSTRPDGAYAWVTDARTPLAPWPTWLMPKPREVVQPIRDPQAVAAANADSVLAGLVRTVLDAPQGTRNDKLFWSGCRLAEHVAAGRLHLDTGAAALIAAARQVGLTDTDAHRTLDSAIRRVAA